jgi:hypothetical protein
MRHPFAVSVVTLAIFSFMAIVIMEGDVKFGAPAIPKHTIKMIAMDVGCRMQTMNRDSKQRSAFAASIFKTLSGVCDAQPTCDIDTHSLYVKAERLPTCTEEFIVTYQCSPDTHEKQVFLYEGQHVTLHCQR